MKSSATYSLLVIILSLICLTSPLFAGTIPKLKWEAKYPNAQIINGIDYISLGLDGSLLALGGWNDGTYTAVIAISPKNGSIQWRTVLGEDTIRFGVSMTDVADKGIVLTGFADKTALRSPLLSRPFEAIISNNGKNVEYTSWSKDKYKTVYFREDKRITRTRKGGIAVISDLPYQGPYIITFRTWDSNGVFQTEALHDTMPKANLTVNSLLETQDGGFAILYEIGVGIPDSTFLVKYNTEGREVWRNKISLLPRNYYRGAMLEIPDGSLVVVTNVFASKPDTGRAVLQFFSSGGELLRSKSYVALGVMSIRDIARMPDGGYIMAGYTGNSWAVIGDSLQYILIRTDADGNQIWQKVWGQSKVRDLLSTVSVAPDGTIYAGGYSAGIEGGYIGAFTEETLGVESDTPVSETHISPNPAVESFTVHCPDATSVTVRDVFGKIWTYRSEITGGETTILTADYASGVYFVEVTERNNSRMVQKVVISR